VEIIGPKSPDCKLTDRSMQAVKSRKSYNFLINVLKIYKKKLSLIVTLLQCGLEPNGMTSYWIRDLPINLKNLHLLH
jgi:hypothetical protein